MLVYVCRVAIFGKMKFIVPVCVLCIFSLVKRQEIYPLLFTIKMLNDAFYSTSCLREQLSSVNFLFLKQKESFLIQIKKLSVFWPNSTYRKTECFEMSHWNPWLTLGNVVKLKLWNQKAYPNKTCIFLSVCSSIERSYVRASQVLNMTLSLFACFPLNWMIFSCKLLSGICCSLKKIP